MITSKAKIIIFATFQLYYSHCSPFQKKSRKILAFDAKHCKFHKLHCFHIFQCFFDNALNKVLVGYIIQKRSSSNQQQNHQSVCLSTVLPVANLPPVISDY